LTENKHQKGHLEAANMLKTIESKAAAGTLSSLDASRAASDLSDSLSHLRSSGDISNDAYLEAGVIQGGLTTLSNLIEQGCELSEIELHVANLIQRATSICEIHSDLKAHLLI